MNVRFGIGYDVHRLIVNRKLIIGGVEIPFVKGLLGHSDADVLCHALADALLGAAALGEIGTHFPASDPRFKELWRRGLQIGQVSVKSTTNEELGFIGLGEGGAAYAIASIRSIPFTFGN